MIFYIGEVQYRVDAQQQVVVSCWPDGVRLPKTPNLDPESIERARKLGYTDCTERDAVWRMTRDHDACHHLYAVALGKPWSEHLYRVATGETSADGDAEERAVLLLQRTMNLGRVPLFECAAT